MSQLEFQIEIEKLFHKNQLIPRIMQEFQSEPLFAQIMTERHIDMVFGFNLLAQMVLHKRASLPTLVGILRRHFEGDSTKTANELQKALYAGLVKWETVARQFIIKYGITDDVQADLDRYQYPLPLVVPPQEIKTNKDNGYYTSKGSVILKDNHHDQDVCLDHLNRVNKIRLKLNQNVALNIKNHWKGLDKPKPDEDHREYQKRVKMFDKYNRTAYDVINHLGLSNEGEFWLTHKYDKRGRTYCQGYHVNYQGACWNKAVVHFADEEITL